jgi:hypothetical protein
LGNIRGITGTGILSIHFELEQNDKIGNHSAENGEKTGPTNCEKAETREWSLRLVSLHQSVERRTEFLRACRIRIPAS